MRILILQSQLAKTSEFLYLPDAEVVRNTKALVYKFCQI